MPIGVSVLPEITKADLRLSYALQAINLNYTPKVNAQDPSLFPNIKLTCALHNCIGVVNIGEATSIRAMFVRYEPMVLILTNVEHIEGNTDKEREEAKEFSDWILSINNGDIGDDNDGEATIDIADDLLVHNFHLDHIEAIVEKVYPSLYTVQQSSKYYEERIILAPKHEEVKHINHFVLSLLSGEEIEYLSSYSLCKSDLHLDADTKIYTLDYLNTVRVYGIPHHQLKFKIGVPVILLRNIDQSAGLVNGTRLILTDLGKHVTKGHIISGNNVGHSVLIPMMSWTPTDSGLPFKFTCRQFPVNVCFAMTINKS